MTDLNPGAALSSPLTLESRDVVQESRRRCKPAARQIVAEMAQERHLTQPRRGESSQAIASSKH
jgi:hypothetical protein